MVSVVSSYNRKAAEHENQQNFEKMREDYGKSRENQIFISATSKIPPNKSFQPWNIDIVDTSLQYARNIATRKVALTILAYSTIKEWYYLAREQEESQAAGQNANSSFQEGELFNPHFYNLLNF